MRRALIALVALVAFGCGGSDDGGPNLHITLTHAAGEASDAGATEVRLDDVAVLFRDADAEGSVTVDLHSPLGPHLVRVLIGDTEVASARFAQPSGRYHVAVTRVAAEITVEHRAEPFDDR